ncbi:hypothetical protein QFZ30_001377 [Arthrobacter pascens]|uniref:hypothetical protein n=1 Tax=Arthrobacter pascens TaxID=1677 RepID=UPI0027927C97|nr:hypothetical protein [Arthrobacter pascens]MDQ0677995.1 hypothetical protein [Arthrobacter pascens]
MGGHRDGQQRQQSANKDNDASLRDFSDFVHYLPPAANYHDVINGKPNTLDQTETKELKYSKYSLQHKLPGTTQVHSSLIIYEAPTHDGLNVTQCQQSGGSAKQRWPSSLDRCLF